MFSSLRNQNDDGSVEAQQAPHTTEASTSLAWDTRMQCFAGCFVLSCVASLCASALLVIGQLTGFCVLTSIGSALSLIGTFFLMGPAKQCASMFSQNRWLASLAYIAFIVMALISGLVLKIAPLAIIFTVLQYLAMAYYSLTPYIDRLLCSCF